MKLFSIMNKTEFIENLISVFFLLSFFLLCIFLCLICSYPPASEGSREVANLTERKNPHTPVYGVKEFVCLSVINFSSLLNLLFNFIESTLHDVFVYKAGAFIIFFGT